MVITDLPVRIPGLGACAACVAEKSAHLPHKEGSGLACKYLERVHVDIASPIPVLSAGRERICERRRGWPHSCRIDKVAAPQIGRNRSTRSIQGGGTVENKSGTRIRDHDGQLGTMLHTMVPYHLESNGAAELLMEYPP